ncbi:MAG: hypothetical protein COA81_12710 [Alphaproteobacteria bacterium]|nr:MAG: hypothetical protein COA81_12710 [Alphaproteobacteria bacterium]
MAARATTVAPVPVMSVISLPKKLALQCRKALMIRRQKLIDPGNFIPPGIIQTDTDQEKEI